MMIFQFYPFFQEKKNQKNFDLSLKISHPKTSINLFYNQKKIILDLEK